MKDKFEPRKIYTELTGYNHFNSSKLDFEWSDSYVEWLESELIIAKKESTINKDIKDLLNWVKSDISQEENPKLGKTATSYRTEKLKFLYKIEKLLNTK